MDFILHFSSFSIMPANKKSIDKRLSIGSPSPVHVQLWKKKSNMLLKLCLKKNYFTVKFNPWAFFRQRTQCTHTVNSSIFFCCFCFRLNFLLDSEWWVIVHSMQIFDCKYCINICMNNLNYCYYVQMNDAHWSGRWTLRVNNSFANANFFFFFSFAFENFMRDGFMYIWINCGLQQLSVWNVCMPISVFLVVIFFFLYRNQLFYIDWVRHRMHMTQLFTASYWMFECVYAVELIVSVNPIGKNARYFFSMKMHEKCEKKKKNEFKALVFNLTKWTHQN